MKLNIKRVGEVDVPKYAHATDAAFDLQAAKEVVILPGEHAIVPTGLAMEIPLGYWGNIRDRSGLPAKHAVHTMAGVVDSGYRGEVGVILINLGKEAFTVEHKMRIAQMIIAKCELVEFTEVEDVSDSDRGEGSWGSTGK